MSCTHHCKDLIKNHPDSKKSISFSSALQICGSDHQNQRLHLLQNFLQRYCLGEGNCWWGLGVGRAQSDQLLGPKDHDLLEGNDIKYLLVLHDNNQKFVFNKQSSEDEFKCCPFWDTDTNKLF